MCISSSSVQGEVCQQLLSQLRAFPWLMSVYRVGPGTKGTESKYILIIKNKCWVEFCIPATIIIIISNFPFSMFLIEGPLPVDHKAVSSVPLLRLSSPIHPPCRAPQAREILRKSSFFHAAEKFTVFVIVAITFY